MRYGRRNGIQLAKPLEDKLLRAIYAKSDFAYIQPKLDGVRCRALIDPYSARCVLLSSEENIISSVPHINEAILRMHSLMPPAQRECCLEFDGELYLHGKSFEQIMSIVGRKTNKHLLSHVMQFHIFDVVLDVPETVRRALVKSLPEVEGLEKILTLTTKYNEIPSIMNNFVERGYEGVIIRDPLAIYARKRINGMLKFKPTKSDSYLIACIEEAITEDGGHTGRAGAITCLDHDLKNRFNVSLSFDHSTCREMWEERESYTGKFAKVVYQSLTSTRAIPRFGRAVEIVDREATEFTSI